MQRRNDSHLTKRYNGLCIKWYGNGYSYMNWVYWSGTMGMAFRYPLKKRISGRENRSFGFDVCFVHANKRIAIE